jgi:outer membrane protein, heavy metal efflux system
MRTILIVLGLFVWSQVKAQLSISLDSCRAQMRRHAPEMVAAEEMIKAAEARAKGAVSIPAPQVYLESPTSQFMTPGITQTMEFPTVYRIQQRQGQTALARSKVDKDLRWAALEQKLMTWYFEAAYQRSICTLMWEWDSLSTEAKRKIDVLFAKGLTGTTQRDLAHLKAAEHHTKRIMAEQKLDMLQMQVAFLCGWSEPVSVPSIGQIKDEYAGLDGQGGLFLKSQSLIIEESQRAIQLAKHKALPGLMVGYLNQGNRNSAMNLRWQFGITLPIWWWQYKSDIESAKHEMNATKAMVSYEEQLRIQRIQSAYQQLTALEAARQEYEQSALQNDKEFWNNSNRLLDAGEISYTEYLLLVEQSFGSREQYFQLLHEISALRTIIYYNQQ